MTFDEFGFKVHGEKAMTISVEYEDDVIDSMNIIDKIAINHKIHEKFSDIVHRNDSFSISTSRKSKTSKQTLQALKEISELVENVNTDKEIDEIHDLIDRIAEREDVVEEL